MTVTALRPAPRAPRVYQQARSLRTCLGAARRLATFCFWTSTGSGPTTVEAFTKLKRRWTQISL